MERIIHMIVPRTFAVQVFLLICMTGNATHNRAGQLLYRHIEGYTYEFSQVHFFATNMVATDQRLRLVSQGGGMKVSWGDGTESKMECVRSEIERLPDNYTKAVFREKHTFPGPGTYPIYVEDPNRNDGVLNIPNSVNVVYSNKTIFMISPNFRHNNTPTLLTYPIDKAALGRRFVHNPSAYDTDGDSLSYEIAICTRERGVEIETYSFPETSKELYVDAITGDFVWDAPVKKGLYNVAMRINEWRLVGSKMTKIGSVVRDMQIEVVESNNKPPKLPNFRDTCVIAGTFISIPVNATDPDNDRIVLTATGGPFEVLTHKATLDPVPNGSGQGYTNATFTWQTDYSHVRKQPYTVVFKAEDQPQKPGDVKLVTFATFNITVIAPKVENLTATAEKKDILLEWNPTVCEHASGYEIYRSIGSIDPLDLDLCETGIPSRYDYEKIAVLDGIGNTLYRDNNNGKGLSPGILYGYRVVAVFSDGAKSKPSNEACATLLAGTPPMIRAHVEKISEKGEIHVWWLEKPVQKAINKYLENNPDKIDAKFEYRLFYSNDRDIWSAKPLRTTDFGIEDTTYQHFNVDTKTGQKNKDGITEFHHYYKVELWEKGGAIVDTDYEVASTLYPILHPSDKSVIITFGRYAPWINEEYDIYLCDKNGDNTVFVDNTRRETYTHYDLKNGQEYCYIVQSKGYRNIDNIEYRNDNRSHVACVIPEDNVPPCPPEITGDSNCDENHNLLEWMYQNECMYDVETFRIYYSPDGRKYDPIGSVNRDEYNPYTTFRYNYADYHSLVGCYYVTAVDSAGNESPWSNIVCLDKCGDYQLPNVFTPDGDGFNDVYKSFNPAGVKKVDMKILNRWGKLVFKTNDPNINWDGRDMDSKRFVSTGVYYYFCDVYEERLTGSGIVTLSGFIHVYTGKDAKPYDN